MPRVLLLGAGGMLAHDLAREAPAGMDLVPRTAQELDITDAAAVGAAVTRLAPDVVINCAAYTDVDGAETHFEQAMAVNGEAPGHVAAALAAARTAAGEDVLLVHYGSDYVFDGTGTRPWRETDPCAPLGRYAESKLAGERSISARGKRYLVIRTQWLYGVNGRSFPRTIRERARAGQPTRVVNDQTGRLTYTVDLARATWRLVAMGHAAPQGTLHVANSGCATWYDVARHIFQRAGRPELLSPCTTAEFPRPARRPAFSALDTSLFEQITGSALPAWQDGLDRFLDEITEEQPGA